ncbi:MAG: OB-fold domain-containing protein [Actinobacteria bacterium]|nr:OB-fold domain-containing protein [Actinomycetota bacterium]
MRGIVGASGYIPRGRLDLATIAPVSGSGGGKGVRSVASYDEDTTTMAVEAGRLALRSVPDIRPDTLWFSTVTPAYVDKTNATAIHAALRLDAGAAAIDLGGAQRSAIGALSIALRSTGVQLVVAADLRTGLPGSSDEAAGGDGAAAVIVGDTGLIAEFLGGASMTAEFLDRWRTPGDVRSKVWEERFGETKYTALGQRAWQEALKTAGVEPDTVDRVVITGLHGRAARAAGGRLKRPIVDDLGIGNTGAAHPLLLLTAALETAAPGETIALVVLADGADVALFRATDAIAARRSPRPVAAQAQSGADVPYGKFLSWRGVLPTEPPRRPEPARLSASAAGRSEQWKFGFVAARDPGSGDPQLPPRPSGGEPVPMADVAGTIATFTVDRLAYSPSPPIVFAIVDFDGGGRLPVELTDVRPDEVRIGGRVEMTFRKLSTADGIHNYFWKARPVVPEARKETVVPEARKETVVPEARKETVVPEARKETVVPEARKETDVQ